MERQVKWIWTSFLNILRLPAKIRSISLQNLCRTVTLLKYGVICWTSLTLIVVSLARPESRIILLMVWTITFQGYFYARSKVGVWLAWVAWAVCSDPGGVKDGQDQSTLNVRCWPAQGHRVWLHRILGLYTWSKVSLICRREKEFFTRWIIISNWGQIIWRLTLALWYWGIPVIIVAIFENVIVHEAHEFGHNSVIVSPLSLKYPTGKTGSLDQGNNSIWSNKTEPFKANPSQWVDS